MTQDTPHPTGDDTFVDQSAQAASAERCRHDRARHAGQLMLLTGHARHIVGESKREPVRWRRSSEARAASEEFQDRLVAAEQELQLARRDLHLTRQVHQVACESGADPRDDLIQLLDRSSGRACLSSQQLIDTSYVIVLFKLDRLSEINLGFGCEVGDDVIANLASTVAHDFPGETVIRWNGNRLVVASRNIGLASAVSLAQQALAHFSTQRFRVIRTGESIGTLTASAGAARGYREPIGPVLDRAHALTNEAQLSGGNQALT